MRMKIVILFVLTALFSTPTYAQLNSNIKAKLYYTEAEKTFAQGDFESSLEYVIKAENTLGTVVARTLALKIKIQYNLGNFIEAKELLDAYTADYMDEATQELNDEILGMYISIEEAAEAVASRKAEVQASIRARSGEFTDSRDGKTYQTIKIGMDVWMAENLNYRTGSGSWCYGDVSANCEKYGRLYTWETAKRVCPAGWHLPSDREWTLLTGNLGGEDVSGTKMKSTSGWEEKEYNGTNESGFSGLPGGERDYDGTFSGIGIYGIWWSSTESSTFDVVKIRGVNNYGIVISSSNKDDGAAVRCLRD